LPKAPNDGRLDSIMTFSSVAQRTGSAVLDVSERVNRPGGPQAVFPVEKMQPSHREPPPTTTSGLLLPRWKAPRRVRNHPPEHVDEICLWHCQYAPRLPLFGDPGERPVYLELSGKDLHWPWTQVPVPSVAVARGPRSRAVA